MLVIILLWILGICCVIAAFHWLREKDSLRFSAGMTTLFCLLWPVGLPMLLTIGLVGADRVRAAGTDLPGDDSDDA